MSGEYYSNEVGECSNLRDDYNLQTNRTNHVDKRSCDGADGTYTKRSQDCQLHEIEEQLELAENRCNTLKGQLQFMKNNYQKSNPRELGSGTSKWKRPVSTVAGSVKNQFELDTFESFDVYPRRSSSSFPLQSESPAKSGLVRQNSTSIGTDHTGAAVRTINNILSGITNSVNGTTPANCRPFLNDIGGTCAISGGPFSPRLKKRLQEQQKRVDRLVQDARFSSVNDIKVCNLEETSGEDTQDASIDKWAKSVTCQMKSKAQGSSVTINLPKFAKSRQIDDDLKKRRRSLKRLKPVSKLSIIKKLGGSESGKQISKLSSENLVEIYHNLAAKSSESDDDHKPHPHTRQGAGDLPSNATGALSPIQENAIVRQNYFNHVPKNYQQQTIASQLKRVTKNYLRSFNYFNFRCIPFCAAKSTSPSHNIGVNIQQVMSIIKTRQPITGISPTLAHNISLAAEKLQGSPLSTFVSNLSTRIGSQTCPLTKHSLNYHKLQEMAKAIPEEAEEEETDAKNLLSVEVPPPVPPIWTSEPSTGRCTCVPKKGVPFQKVVSKYQVSNADNFHSSSKLMKPVRRPDGVTSKQRTAAWVSTTAPTESKPSGISEQKHLTGNEKNLKTVLKNLHDEFNSLNATYEALSKTSTNAAPEVLQQLEEMDTQLNQKEEEIKMVMSLCTEVMALKDQVKKLKERASCEALTECKPMDSKREPNAALHLTQLLRQIQNYQKQFQTKD